MSICKEGWLKIKLDRQSRCHRRYCSIDWDRSVLFTASKAEARYRDWIKLLPNILINECEHPLATESNTANSNHAVTHAIEIKVDNGAATHLLQAETKADYDSWLSALKRTAYSRIGGAIFSQSLNETYKYSHDRTVLVPLIIRQCCEHLLEHGLTFVGLFRVPGKQSAIRELRDLYDRGIMLQLNETQSPASVSSLLKTYLQSLPEPIIPTKSFDDFLEIGSRLKYNQSNDLHRLKQLIENTVPTINYAVLAYLCSFLKKLTDHAHTTKMDTDNLAVVFGSNLIRPEEELDLNMIKGHNYNLLPLVKVFIDQSEYLFSNPPTHHSYDAYEQTTKSSGFSSASSLLESHDMSMLNKARSASLPSICLPASLSSDSATSSHDNRAGAHAKEYRSALSTDNSMCTTSDCIADCQSSTDSFKFDSRNENHAHIRQSRSASTDLVDTDRVKQTVKRNSGSMNDILLQVAEAPTYPDSYSATTTSSIPIRKMEKYPPKKSLAHKFGKPFSTLRFSVSKALQTHGGASTEVIPQLSDPSARSSIVKRPMERQSYDFTTSNDNSRRLHDEITSLKESLNRQESLIAELNRASRNDRLKFEREKCQLNQQIEHLLNENSQLRRESSV